MSQIHSQGNDQNAVTAAYHNSAFYPQRNSKVKDHSYPFSYTTYTMTSSFQSINQSNQSWIFRV